VLNALPTGGVEIVFETHSISEDNERGVASGWLDGRLSPRGRLFARELGRRRQAEVFDAIYVSDLNRAVETATLAFGHTGIPIVKDARLRECNYGEMNGCDTALLQGRRHAWIDTRFPHGQSYREVVRQMQLFLRELTEAHPGGKVLLIGHSATRWALEVLLAGKALETLVDAPFNWQPGWHYRLPDLALAGL